MLPQIQNVVSARELFNPNPCRDMWESQQYSQAASCSQGSQHSSMELFSQSKNSQQKGNSLFSDGWNASTNSQHMNEDEPKKYYMKYMSKPPLHPDLDKQLQQNTLALNYKDFIETQKKRAAERDEKDVLDNFITLLKDYTKEVKSALDSFRSNMDLTLTAKAEQMACAADQSTTLISKLKEELLDNFSDLRKEIKENQIIKEEVAKQNEKLVEQNTEVKMLRDQLEDYKMRERKGLEKEASLLEREAQLLEKLREMSTQQQALLIRGYSDIPRHSADTNSCTGLVVEQPENLPQYGAQMCSIVNNAHLLANEPKKLPTRDSVRNYGSSSTMAGQQNNFLMQQHQLNLSHIDPPALPVRLHHLPQLTEPVSAAREIMQPAPCTSERFQELEYNQRSIRSNGFVERVVGRGILDMSERYQTRKATVAPVQSIQPPLSLSRNSREELEKTESSHCTIAPTHGVHESTFKTPSGQLNTGSFAKTHGRKKWSPVATVLPQVKVKTEHSENVKNDVYCPKRKAKDDPLNIFMFDLTANDSPDTADAIENQSEKEEELGSLANGNIERSKSLVSSGYHTRSKGRLDHSMPCPEVPSSRPSRSENTLSNAVHKVYKVKSRQALKRTYSFDGSGTDSDDDLYMRGSTSYDRKANLTSRKAERSFSRNVTSKRTLSIDPSVFDLTEDNVDIQQITECIRRHAQQKKMFKRTRTT